VLISHPDLCAQAKVINVLFCTTSVKAGQFGRMRFCLTALMAWIGKRFDCSIIYAIRSDLLSGKRGRVSLERRRAIRAALRDMFLLGESD
jgi:hypothetical protein